MTQTEVGGATPDSETAEPLVPLWRNWRFQALWSGAAASMLGAQVADTAYPLLLLGMTGSSAVAGAFGAVQLVSQILFSLHGGSVADRYDRRRVLMIADGLRFVVAASVPVALWLHCLTVTQTMLVAVAIGAGTAYTGPTRMLAVRSVVPKAQLRQALSQDEVRTNGAGLAGPPLAGYLFGLLRQAPFVATALGSLSAFVAACVVRFEVKNTGGGPRGGALEGLRYLIGSKDLRPALGGITAFTFATTALTLPVIVILRDHGTSSGGIGLALAGEAVGGIVGAFFVTRLHGLLGPGKLLLASTWICVPVFFVPLLPGGPLTVFVGLLIATLGTPALRVMIDVLIFQRVDPDLRGRAMAAAMMIFMTGVPAGTLVSGLLLNYLRPAAALSVIAGLLVLALLPATLSKPLRRSEWPA